MLHEVLAGMRDLTQQRTSYRPAEVQEAHFERSGDISVIPRVKEKRLRWQKSPCATGCK